MNAIAPPSAPKIIDPFNRTIDYLRVSVTDRCNYRCNYCMPERGYHPEGHHSEYLSFEELQFIIECFVELGLKNVRITGGEPLVRKGLEGFIQNLSGINGLNEIALSTNAHRLEKHAAGLAQAGLDRVNVSMDSLIAEKFKAITRGGDLNAVLSGVYEAQRVGLSPVKINCVVMKGVNDDEIESMAEWAINHHIDLRFIEIMPIGSSGIELMKQHYPSDLILQRIEQHFGQSLSPTTANKGNGPARYYKISNSQNKIGVISAVSQHFCETCNRVRLTSKGVLALCLGQSDSVNLLEPLRQNVSKEVMKTIILEAIKRKPERHFFRENVHNIEFRQMASLGG